MTLFRMTPMILYQLITPQKGTLKKTQTLLKRATLPFLVELVKMRTPKLSLILLLQFLVVQT